MKRYLVFVGSYFYPLGGMKDFTGSYFSIEFAIESISIPTDDYSWAHIYDCKTFRIVKKKYQSKS